LAVTTSSVVPSGSPSTRPVRVLAAWFAENAAVTSVPPAAMATWWSGTVRGTATSTRASPPLTWSGAPDSTVMVNAAGFGSAEADNGADSAATTATAAAPTIRRRVPTWLRMVPPRDPAASHGAASR
jgi:hypothetical protein